MQLTPQQSELYTSVSTSPPTAETMTVCYGFVCRRRVELDFTAADRKTLTQIMAAGKASAVAERAAIQKAVLWFDKRMGPVIGTTTRVARADIRNRADASNYDCWDSTRNVSSLLLVLQQWGLLKHHTVGNPRYRGNILAMQLPAQYGGDCREGKPLNGPSICGRPNISSRLTSCSWSSG